MNRDGSTRPGSFAVLSNKQVHAVLVGQEVMVSVIVANTYRVHGNGETENPPSYFLRFRTDPHSRIIALPASLESEPSVAGVKWIASFPRNRTDGRPRASAVVILNDRRTGVPYACIEGSLISAARTAASAVVGAEWMTKDLPRPKRLSCIGLGPIAETVVRHLAASGWKFDSLTLCDIDPTSIEPFMRNAQACGIANTMLVSATADDAIEAGDLVVFATTAVVPYVQSVGPFGHNPVVLNISLRDLGTDVIRGSANIVDDAEHCLRENTSVHLTREETGGTSFLNGELWQLMTGALVLPHDRPRIFSPFGLGVLDLAVADWVYKVALETGALSLIDEFTSVGV